MGVGLVPDFAGNIRYAFLFLVSMFWAALPVLAGVDVERVRADAHVWSSSHRDDGDEVGVDAVVNQDR